MSARDERTQWAVKMLRKLGSTLLYTCRNRYQVTGQCRAICIGGFQSNNHAGTSMNVACTNLDTLHPANRSVKTYSTGTVKLNNSKEAVVKSTEEEEFSGEIPVGKLKVKYSHSSGPGGQHVNKVNTKAEVRFHVQTAGWLSQHIRDKILEKKQTRINNAGELIFWSDRTRSQITNFADCLQKIRDTVAEVSRKPKEPTEEDIQVFALRIEKANRERLKQKKLRSSVKRDRKVFAE